MDRGERAELIGSALFHYTIYADILPFFLVRWGSKCLLEEKSRLVV